MFNQNIMNIIIIIVIQYGVADVSARDSRVYSNGSMLTLFCVCPYILCCVPIF